MHIFQQEYDDGIADIISTSASFSYASYIQPCNQNSNNKYFKALAAVNDSDLYYTQSILVSSSWNKNDDIFDKEEVWKAKNSPEHKPTNLEHNEAAIVGHIIANWPVTIDGILINEETPVENLPDKFNILTASVIYKSFTSPELKDRTEKLISEIEDGTKFVSMECFFTGFDYGLINKTTGEYKVLSRSNDTSYLSKHLRAYGGTGEHEGYKIGRVLRNITFSGKGFVDRPANPDSIIFSKDSFQFVDDKLTKNEDFSKSGVINFQSNINHSENQIMSDNSVAETNTVAEETQVEVLDCTQAQEEIKAAAEVSMSELKTQLTSEFDATIAAVRAELDNAKAELEKLNVQSSETQAALEAKVTELESQLATANDSIAAYMKKEKKMMRKASLLDEGFDSEKADQMVEKFDSLDDETFAAMTEMLKEKKTKKEKMKAEDITETVDIEVALENVEESTEPAITVGGEDDSQVETTRAALVDFVRTRLSK
jgi:predicted  nucleic acid-binding Zn-ribbon protein